MAVTFDVEAARAQFPALQQEQVFMDNAGGIYILLPDVMLDGTND